MNQNLLLTKVTGKFGTALFGVAKVIADRYGGIVSEVELPEYGLKTLKFRVVGASRKTTRKDGYEMPCSPTQNYKMLGNGWTIKVIKHILSHIPEIASGEPIEVLSMYDGMACARIALKELGVNIVRYYATEIDKYAIQTTQANFPDTIQLGDAFQVREENWKI